jgi:ADP-heptose:LPS heptosyltransferase
LGSTSDPRSPDAEAERILSACLRGEAWAEGDLRRLIDRESPDLFRVVAEGLSDCFDARLSDDYAAIFARVIAAVLPQYEPAQLSARYGRVRQPRRFKGTDPRIVYLLSRVTLGADVAITSVILDGMKHRFPASRIVFAGPAKSFELFSADPRIEHLPVPYGRSGSLRSCIGIFPELSEPHSIVIDPDSRLTQLGLLPICQEESYYFFDSRASGGDGAESLGCLAKRWLRETFEIEGARAYISPREQPQVTAEIAVSLGVGGNTAKLVPPPFEALLLESLSRRGSMIVDIGAGGEEAERVRHALGAAPVGTWQGSFAGFASIIARSRLYIGYDSAGQHVAAACGVPLVTVFAGAPCERFRQRWSPSGPGRIEVVGADAARPLSVLEQTLAASARVITAA